MGAAASAIGNHFLGTDLAESVAGSLWGNYRPTLIDSPPGATIRLSVV